jgi:hypothetical protein
MCQKMLSNVQRNTIAKPIEHEIKCGGEKMLMDPNNKSEERKIALRLCAAITVSRQHESSEKEMFYQEKTNHFGSGYPGQRYALRQLRGQQPCLFRVTKEPEELEKRFKGCLRKHRDVKKAENVLTWEEAT